MAGCGTYDSPIIANRFELQMRDNARYIVARTEHFKSKISGETASIRQTAKALGETVSIQIAETCKTVSYNAYDQTLETQNLFTQQKEASARLNANGTVLTDDAFVRVADNMKVMSLP